MNVPKLRFKEFNDEWCLRTLNELYTFKNGINGDRTQFGKGIKFISVGDILNNNYITYDKIKGLIDIDEKTLHENSVEFGDILFQRSSETRKEIGMSNVYLDNKLSTFGGFVIRGKKNKDNKNNPSFINYLLRSQTVRKDIVFRGAGAQHYNIGQEDLKKVSINIPSLAEQNKISNILELLDKKIELQTKKIEDLKLFKLYTENNLLNSNASINWKETKLSDILIEGNKIPVKNTNDFKKITIKLNLNGLEFNETKREMSDTRPFYVRDENEIIIGKQNYFNGSIAIVTKKFAGCICSNAIMSFKVKEEFDLDYIYLYLSQKKYMKQREFLANGTGQKELSEREFLKFTIKIPDDSTIKRITSTINSINNKINLENNKLNKLMELKKGLMQNMFV